MNIEVWQYTDTESKIFTDSKDILELIFNISRIKHTSSIYTFKGKIIGWDMVIPTKFVKKIQTEFNKQSKPKPKEKIKATLSAKEKVKKVDQNKKTNQSKNSNIINKFFDLESNEKIRKKK